MRLALFVLLIAVWPSACSSGVSLTSASSRSGVTDVSAALLEARFSPRSQHVYRIVGWLGSSGNEEMRFALELRPPRGFSLGSTTQESVLLDVGKDTDAIDLLGSMMIAPFSVRPDPLDIDYFVSAVGALRHTNTEQVYLMAPQLIEVLYAVPKGNSDWRAAFESISALDQGEFVPGRLDVRDAEVLLWLAQIRTNAVWGAGPWGSIRRGLGDAADLAYLDRNPTLLKLIALLQVRLHKRRDAVNSLERLVGLYDDGLGARNLSSLGARFLQGALLLEGDPSTESVVGSGWGRKDGSTSVYSALIKERLSR